MRKAVMMVLATVALLAIASASAANLAVTSVQAAGAQSATGTSSAPISVYPGETWTQTYLAQQYFQRGFIFWNSTSKTIWVLLKADENATSGEWRSYKDTFVDGDQEIDQSLTPPDPLHLYQPRRGFGKLWRKPSDLFDKLGWGTTPEFEESTPLGYLAGANGTPGRYLILSLGLEIFSLNEAKAGEAGGTWKLVGVNVAGNPNSRTFTPTPGGPGPVATQAAMGPVVTAAATQAK